MERIRTDHREEGRYHTTVLICLIAALALLNLLARYWPEWEAAPNTDRVFDTSGIPVELEMVEQTQQAAKPPAPPLPLPPVEVPDDVILDFEQVEPSEEITFEGEGEEQADSAIPGPRLVAQADQGPRPIRFVEPEYSVEARKKKIKATILVEVLVDERGRVVETRIIDRFIYEKKGEPPIPVNEIGFGLEEAAVAAAERWRFRPARHGGRVVQTYTTLTFRFGV
jgi:protein TonB